MTCVQFMEEIDMAKIKSLKDWLLRIGGNAKIGIMSEVGGNVTYLRSPDEVKLISAKKGESFIIIVNEKLYTVHCSKRGRLEVTPIKEQW